MTEKELAAIEARHAPTADGCCAHCDEYTDHISDDIRALVAEVRHLRAVAAPQQDLRVQLDITQANYDEMRATAASALERSAALAAEVHHLRALLAAAEARAAIAATERAE